jgi:hypothetical protein
MAVGAPSVRTVGIDEPATAGPVATATGEEAGNVVGLASVVPAGAGAPPGVRMRSGATTRTLTPKEADRSAAEADVAMHPTRSAHVIRRPTITTN